MDSMLIILLIHVSHAIINYVENVIDGQMYAQYSVIPLA